MHACCLQDPEEGLDPLLLEIQTLTSLYLGAGSQTWLLEQEQSVPLAIEPSLRPQYLKLKSLLYGALVRVAGYADSGLLLIDRSVTSPVSSIRPRNLHEA